MKIAGQSFAFLTQLTQDKANRATPSADDRVAKRAAMRAERIEQARAAQLKQVETFQTKSFKDTLGAKTGSNDLDRREPSKREALGTPRPQTPPQPGQRVNIVI